MEGSKRGELGESSSPSLLMNQSSNIHDVQMPYTSSYTLTLYQGRTKTQVNKSLYSPMVEERKVPSILSAATGVAATASVLYSVTNAMLELKYRKICDEAMGDFAKRKEVQAFKRKGKKVF